MIRFLWIGFSSILLTTVCWGSEFWHRNLTYEQIVQLAQDRSPYHMGLLGIYLRSGESGCSVNLDAATQWSQATLKAGHPFGAYNLANLAMLRGDFAEATRLYQDAALLLQRRASEGDPVAMCTAWARLIFRLYLQMFLEHLIGLKVCSGWLPAGTSYHWCIIP